MEMEFPLVSSTLVFQSCNLAVQSSSPRYASWLVINLSCCSAVYSLSNLDMTGIKKSISPLG
jgi:hypothetical protein